MLYHLCELTDVAQRTYYSTHVLLYSTPHCLHHVVSVVYTGYKMLWLTPGQHGCQVAYLLWEILSYSLVEDASVRYTGDTCGVRPYFIHYKSPLTHTRHILEMYPINCINNI